MNKFMHLYTFFYLHDRLFCIRHKVGVKNMKKFLNLLLVFLVFMGLNCANAQEATQNIQFIYINGSNSNDENAKEAYVKGFHDLHKQMKNTFENDEFILKNMLDNGKYSINSNEEILFWGFNSKQELDVIKNNLAEAKKSSPVMAQTIRNILAHCMHDAIWVQREANMQKIINQLHKNVMRAHSKGEKVILLGHSAGSFVTYEYMLHKLKGVNLDLLTEKNDHKFTCIDAFVQSGLGYQLATDKLKINPNEKQFAQAYKDLDKYTESACTPDDTLMGVINFGSPLSLFYSSQISRSADNSAAYQLYFLKYLQENNIFFLTVNFADDPIGFPVSRNVSKADIEMTFNTTLSDEGKGFVYNYSKVRSTGMFATAHFGYWKHAKRFAKTVRDAYKKGYINFYSLY